MILSIGESKPKKTKLFASAIMNFEGVDHSHTFVSWKDSLGLRWVLEAKGSGVRILSNSNFKKQAHVVALYQYETTQDKINDVIKFAWEISARDYAFNQIAGLAYMRIGRKLGLKTKNPFQDGDFSLVCCETSLRAIQIATGKVPKAAIENWGLIETSTFNLNTCDVIADQAKLDRINGK